MTVKGRCELGCACNCGLPACGCHESAKIADAARETQQAGGRS